MTTSLVVRRQVYNNVVICSRCEQKPVIVVFETELWAVYALFVHIPCADSIDDKDLSSQHINHRLFGHILLRGDAVESTLVNIKTSAVWAILATGSNKKTSFPPLA